MSDVLRRGADERVADLNEPVGGEWTELLRVAPLAGWARGEGGRRGPTSVMYGRRSPAGAF